MITIHTYTVLFILQIAFTSHWIPLTILWGQYYSHSHFVNEELRFREDKWLAYSHTAVADLLLNPSPLQAKHLYHNLTRPSNVLMKQMDNLIPTLLLRTTGSVQEVSPPGWTNSGQELSATNKWQMITRVTDWEVRQSSRYFTHFFPVLITPHEIDITCFIDEGTLRRWVTCRSTVSSYSWDFNPHLPLPT